jgi:hypothetical protein
MGTIEQLHAIIADPNASQNQKDEAAKLLLAASGESVPSQPEPQPQIADNDPGLAQWGFVNGKQVENDAFDALYNRLNPLSLADAKRALASQRQREKLIATVRNESLPTDQRIAAATQINAEGSFPHLNPEQIVEHLSGTAMSTKQKTGLSDTLTDRLPEQNHVAVEPASLSTPVPDMNKLFEYQKWKITREGEGLPSTVADWIKGEG